MHWCSWKNKVGVGVGVAGSVSVSVALTKVMCGKIKSSKERKQWGILK